MTKLELEVKLEALQKLLGEKVTEQTTYQSQINDLQKQLDDLNKPKLTAKQFDEVSEVIETAIGNFEFDNEDNYSIDFGIDYDGRVQAETINFRDTYELVESIVTEIEKQFKVVKEETTD